MLCQLCDRQMGPYGDSGERKKGPEASAAWCSFCPRLSACTLEHKQPFPSMLLAAAFPCWLWAEEVPKITRRALALVGHSLWSPWGRLTGRLQAGVPLASLLIPALATPLPSFPQVMVLSLLSLFFG